MITRTTNWDCMLIVVKDLEYRNTCDIYLIFILFIKILVKHDKHKVFFQTKRNQKLKTFFLSKCFKFFFCEGIKFSPNKTKSN